MAMQPNFNSICQTFLVEDESAGIDPKLAAIHHSQRICNALGLPYQLENRVVVLGNSRKCWEDCPQLLTPFFIRTISVEAEDLIKSALPSIDDHDVVNKAHLVSQILETMSEIGSILAQKRDLRDLDSFTHAVLSTTVPAVYVTCTQFLTLRQNVPNCDFEALRKQGSRLLQGYLNDTVGPWITGNATGSEPMSINECFVPLLTRLSAIDALELDLSATNTVWKFLIRLVTRATRQEYDASEIISILVRMCEMARASFADVDFNDERMYHRQLKLLRFFLGHLLSITKKFPIRLPDEKIAELLMKVLGATPAYPLASLPEPKASSTVLTQIIEAILTARLLYLSDGDEADEDRWNFIRLFQCRDIGAFKCLLVILKLNDRCSSALQSNLVSVLLPWVLEQFPMIVPAIELDVVSMMLNPTHNLYSSAVEALFGFVSGLRVSYFDRLEMILFNYAVHDHLLVRHVIADLWSFVIKQSAPFLAKKHIRQLWELAWCSEKQKLRENLSSICGKLIEQTSNVDIFGRLPTLVNSKPTIHVADILLSLPLGHSPPEIKAYLTTQLLSVAAGKCLTLTRDIGPLVSSDGSVMVLAPLRLILAIVKHAQLFPANTPRDKVKPAVLAGTAVLSRLRGEHDHGSMFLELATTALTAMRYLIVTADGGTAIEIAETLRYLTESCPVLIVAIAELAALFGRVKIPVASLSRAQHLFAILFNRLLERSTTPLTLHASIEAFRQFAAYTQLNKLDGFIPRERNNIVVNYIKLWKSGNVASVAQQAISRDFWESLNSHVPSNISEPLMVDLKVDDRAKRAIEAIGLAKETLSSGDGKYANAVARLDEVVRMII